MASKRQNPLQRLGERIKTGMAQVDTKMVKRMPSDFATAVNIKTAKKEKK